jgi:hypothetical protein
MKPISLNVFSHNGVIVLLAIFLLTLPALGQTGGQYELSWSTIDGGGGTSTGGSYTLTGTIGQPNAGSASGGIYGLLGGFWPGVSGTAYHPADLNNDYVIGDFELLDYIDLWAQGQVGDFDLLDAIDLWAAGHYYWDPVEEKFKPGEEP